MYEKGSKAKEKQECIFFAHSLQYQAWFDFEFQNSMQIFYLYLKKKKKDKTKGPDSYWLVGCAVAPRSLLKFELMPAEEFLKLQVSWSFNLSGRSCKLCLKLLEQVSNKQYLHSGLHKYPYPLISNTFLHFVTL